MTPERGRWPAQFTSLHVGGAAEYFLLATSGQAMAEGLRWAVDHGVAVRVIGGGSNLLVAEDGVEGLVIKAGNSHFSVEDRGGEPVLVAEAGATWPRSRGGWPSRASAGSSGRPMSRAPSAVRRSTTPAPSVATRRRVCWRSRSSTPAAKDARSTPMSWATPTAPASSSAANTATLPSNASTLRLNVKHPRAADGLVKQFNAQRMRSQPRILSAGSVFANPAGSLSLAN